MELLQRLESLLKSVHCYWYRSIWYFLVVNIYQKCNVEQLGKLLKVIPTVYGKDIINSHLTSKISQQDRNNVEEKSSVANVNKQIEEKKRKWSGDDEKVFANGLANISRDVYGNAQCRRSEQVVTIYIRATAHHLCKITQLCEEVQSGLFIMKIGCVIESLVCHSFLWMNTSRIVRVINILSTAINEGRGQPGPHKHYWVVCFQTVEMRQIRELC